MVAHNDVEVPVPEDVEDLHLRLSDHLNSSWVEALHDTTTMK